MQLERSPEQEQLFQATIRLGELLRRSPQERPGPEEIRRRLRRAGELGLLGLCINKKYDGSGLGALDTALALEAFSCGSRDTGLSFAIAAHLLACAKPIELYAGPELRDSLLPGLCRGELIAANATTEAEAGCDSSRLRTTATRCPEGYSLNGTKLFVTNAPLADLFLVYASCDPALGYQGNTAFLVRRGQSGLWIGRDLGKLGPVGSSLGELQLSDCRVPEGQRLGKEGEGNSQFRLAMAWERACLFAIYLGQMQNDLDSVVDHARNRRQFQKSIGRNQAVSHRIAEMKLRLEGARWLLYRACWCLDQGRESSQEISLAKIAVSEAARDSALARIQIFGGSGVLLESGVAESLCNAVPSTIFSGTTEMQKELVARSLGL